MKKSYIALLLLLCLTLTLPAMAADTPRLVDSAGYLTAMEEAVLLQQLDEISTRQGLDVVIVTVRSLNGISAQAFADDFFDYNGYGDDGILLLVADAEREWAISTAGFGITVFTDAGLAYMEEQFLGALSDGEYAMAFSVFADLCDQFITQARTDAPYDRDSLPKEPFDAVGTLVICLIVGFVIALVATGVMRGQLKSVRSQAVASQYVRPGSLNITESREIFLFRRVQRRKRESQSSGGGGSSIHRSSSGRSHGGRSGKF